MKIIKAVQCSAIWQTGPFKGKRCPETRNLVKCSHSVVNGCDNYFCLIFHWPDHMLIHESEWDQMSEIDKNKIIDKYSG